MKPITDVMREIRKGVGVEEASAQLADVVRAVTLLGKKGEVTIKLEVEPDKGGGNQLTIGMKVTSKRPVMDLPKAVFFSDAEGDLHRVDPAQREMFKDTVDPETGEVMSRPQGRA